MRRDNRRRHLGFKTSRATMTLIEVLVAVVWAVDCVSGDRRHWWRCGRWRYSDSSMMDEWPIWGL